VREVQPVLDRRCVGCHDGSPAAAKIPNFKSEPRSGFTPGYIALHPFVRRPGPESDYHIQVPLEWHTSTSELIQLLEKGHHQVKLSDEEWDRLVTWIDLNVPDHGSWSEQSGSKKKLGEERCRLNKIYTNLRDDPEPDPVTLKRTTIPFVKPDPEPSSAAVDITVENWPFSATEAKRRQATAGLPTTSTIELAAGLTLELTLIPAGTFVMGDPAGAADERPVSAVRIGRPFYMGTCEISNAQFAQYQADHDSGYISYFGKDQNSRGHAVNQPTQPVVRVSWEQAMGFCRWLSEKTGRHFSLPNEAQWEYACRAGTNTPMNYGALDTDFGKMANMADAELLYGMTHRTARWMHVVAAIRDGAVVTAEIQRYPDNAWGLRNMHGNAAEWTRTAYRPYPYREDGRDDASTEGDKVVRGGSFYDRPYRCTSGFRWRYPAWQKVFNVGFRVVCEVSP
jgi:formylglycine-generating enzyme required for sulfatase activity